MATSDFSTCDFKNYRDIQFFQFYGSFSFKPTNLSYEIKCSKLVQTGFLSMIKYFIHISYMIYDILYDITDPIL